MKILFVCTGNSCRSQMAEGLWRARGGETWDVFSAGLSPKGVHPLASRAMHDLEGLGRRLLLESLANRVQSVL